MIKIYFVRHGEKEKIKGDPPLSTNGQWQSAKAAGYFLSIPIDKIISSPAMRAKETAQIISNKLGCNYELTDLLRERANWGDDPNQSFDDFLEMWKKASIDRQWQPSVGDSSFNAGKRLEKFISTLLDHGYKNVILVTHGGIIIDYLRNLFTSKELDAYNASFSKRMYDTVPVCSITTLIFHNKLKKPIIENLTKTDHLLSSANRVV